MIRPGTQRCPWLGAQQPQGWKAHEEFLSSVFTQGPRLRNKDKDPQPGERTSG